MPTLTDAYPVRVWWRDSTQPTPSWQFASDLDEPAVVECQTVGRLIAKTGDAVMIAQSIGGHSDEDSNQCAGVMCIPRSAIIRMWEYHADGGVFATTRQEEHT